MKYIIAICIDYVFVFITYLKYLFFKIYKPQNVLFSVTSIKENVYNDTIDINWILKNIKYSSHINKDKLYLFPHYNLDTMLNIEPEHKIIAAFLKNENNCIDNITTLIRQLAGPRQNFYSDTEYNVNTKDIFGIYKKQLSIITLNKTFVFDLSTNNILNFK